MKTAAGGFMGNESILRIIPEKSAIKEKPPSCTA
jgi:hypothetical protein